MTPAIPPSIDDSDLKHEAAGALRYLLALVLPTEAQRQKIMDLIAELEKVK